MKSGSGETVGVEKTRNTGALPDDRLAVARVAFDAAPRPDHLKALDGGQQNAYPFQLQERYLGLHVSKAGRYRGRSVYRSADEYVAARDLAKIDVVVGLLRQHAHRRLDEIGGRLGNRHLGTLDLQVDVLAERMRELSRPRACRHDADGGPETAVVRREHFEAAAASLDLRGGSLLQHGGAVAYGGSGEGGGGQARIGMSIGGSQGASAHAGTEPWITVAQGVAGEDFQLQPEAGRFLRVIDDPIDVLLSPADAQLTASDELAVVAGQGQLMQGATLPANRSEIGSRGLSADEVALQQGDGPASQRKKECGRCAHDAATDDDCIRVRARHGVVLTLAASGFIGACALRRPTCSTGMPSAAATISAPARPQ